MGVHFQKEFKIADRFDYIFKFYKKIAGGEYVGFSNQTYLSERDTADRNFAVGHYMRESKCFADGVKLGDILDLYFQTCSVEVNCESGAVMAATLANDGVCPITEERAIYRDCIKNVLSIMYSCGMNNYRYSGQFAFRVGLPAKSGVSGCILLVVPDVMGICVWSPLIDPNGNSVRGVRRLLLQGMDLGLTDNEGRSAMHISAGEGHVNCVHFLIAKARVAHLPKDRWGRTPIDDARHQGHEEIVQLMLVWDNKLRSTVTQQDIIPEREESQDHEEETEDDGTTVLDAKEFSDGD